MTKRNLLIDLKVKEKSQGHYIVIDVCKDKTPEDVMALLFQKYGARYDSWGEFFKDMAQATNKLLTGKKVKDARRE